MFDPQHHHVNTHLYPLNGMFSTLFLFWRVAKKKYPVCQAFLYQMKMGIPRLVTVDL